MTRDEQRATQLERLFQGATTRFAQQQPDGSYKPVLRELAYADILDHVRHVEGCTYGFYVIREDNHVKTVCFDIDLPDGTREEAWAVTGKVWLALREAGVRENAMCVEFSGNKGFHVWVFLGEWIAPLKARAWGDTVLEKAGVKCEVFPKGELSDERSFGNLVKLPFALHMKSGREATICVENPVLSRRHRLNAPKGSKTPEEVLANIIPLHYRDIRRIILEPYVLSEAKKRERAMRPDPKTYSDGTLLPCAQHVVAAGSGRGSRNNALYGLALLAKRAGKDRIEAERLCMEANDKCDPSLPRGEVVNTVRSAYLARRDTFRCSQDWLHEGTEPHCVKTCPRYQSSFGNARSK